ncbi:MAG: rod shape-determining protein RodA [Bacteroidales bacterium]|jgi:rod shape determining protein RodA|nr:rod shape-determining protein RodA [Bacteroidales bacterium]
MRSSRASLLASIDWLTVVTYLLLVIIGWVNIYSAGNADEDQSMFDLTEQYGKQILWIGLAIILAIFTMTIDQRFFESFAFVLYGLSMLLLMSVLVIGVEINGAKSWIDFGFFRLQPAEIAKIGTSLALASWMSRYNFNFRRTRDFMVMVGLILFPMALILLQNDMGSVLTYTSFIILFYRRGLNPIYLWLIALGGMIFIFVLSYSPTAVFIALSVLLAIALPLQRKWLELIIYISSASVLLTVWWTGKHFEFWDFNLDLLFYILAFANALFWLIKSIINKDTSQRLLATLTFGSFLLTSSIVKVFSLFGDYQQDRILALLGLKSDPYGVEYHVIQSLIAIGSGGFRGKGFLQGTQTKFDFVPEQTTDFIFSTIGEEFGFIGTFIVIALFLLLMLRLLFLAERQRSSFSKNYAYCVVGIIFFHFVINIGMVTGIGPVIGVPLPYISYGGSSLWGFTLLLFIFLKMDAKRMEVLGD